jgi:hypothetical protein
MPAPNRPSPSPTATHTSSPVCGRECELGSWAVVALTVDVATVAGDVVDVAGGGVVFVGGGEFDVEVVGQPSGSTYCESPADPGHPLPDAASAAPAQRNNGAPIATRHASTSPSLRMAPVLQARVGVVTGKRYRLGVTLTLDRGPLAAAASAVAGRRPASRAELP